MSEQRKAQVFCSRSEIATPCLKEGMTHMKASPWATAQASEVCLIKWITISNEKILEVSWTLCEKVYFDSEHQNILEEINYTSYVYIYIDITLSNGLVTKNIDYSPLFILSSSIYSSIHN